MGFGYKRVLFKFKTENHITLCLVLSEILFRRVSGDTLNLFSELMLARIHKSIREIVPKLRELIAQEDQETSKKLIHDKLDAILLDNAKTIYQELQP